MKRWKIAELDEWNDRFLIAGFLRDRRASCKNVYAPLYKKLTGLIYELERWTNFDDDGALSKRRKP